MRIARPTRMTAVLGLVAIVLVAGVLVTPATAAFGRRRCPGGARSAITAAYYTLFSRSQGAANDDRAAALADGSDPALRQILDTWLADPTDNATTVSTSDIQCTSQSRATLDADLVLASTPLLDVMPQGKAVRQAGVWKVARSTFCARLTVSDPSLASRGACAR